MGAAVLVAIPIWNFRGKSNQAGTIIDARLTLVTSDHDELSCASEQSYSGYRCGLRGPDDPWPTPPKPSEELVQYLSESRQMFLIPGLFDVPVVRARYESERPDRVNRYALHRFVAVCQLRLVERVEEGFSTRWSHDGTWGDGTNAWLAVPVSCRVEG